MELRLSNSSTPWTCRIFLRFERDVEGRPLESVRETRFGNTLVDPNEVEAMLRRAQLAILNPRADPSIFLALSDDEVKAAKEGRPFSGQTASSLSFSTNLICLDISGPQITDLAFVDLPGLISNPDQRGDVELIENMCRTAITGNALILLTVTMRDDYQNQKAVLLAREADPDGKRTVGVLTKADAVMPGEHASWIDLLEGRRNPLTNGFFITKLPALEDLKKNLSFTEARAAEVEFFKSQAPWNNLRLASKSRLGTSKLTEFLSERLGQYIAEKLPKIQADLVSSLDHVRTSLAKLPTPPSSDPVTELHARLSALSHDLDLLVQGAAGHADLVQLKNREDRRFKLAIKATRPVFIPFEKGEKNKIKEWEAANGLAVASDAVRSAPAPAPAPAQKAPLVAAESAPTRAPIKIEFPKTTAVSASSSPAPRFGHPPPSKSLELACMSILHGEVSEEELRVLWLRAEQERNESMKLFLRPRIERLRDIQDEISAEEAREAGEAKAAAAATRAGRAEPGWRSRRPRPALTHSTTPPPQTLPPLNPDFCGELASKSTISGSRHFTFTPSSPAPPSPSPSPSSPPPATIAPAVPEVVATKASPAPAETRKPAKVRDGELSVTAPSAIRMTLDVVREHIEQHKGREVPLNTPYGAKASLMQSALRDWPSLSADALDRLREPVLAAVEQLVEDNLGSARGNELRSIASMVVSDVLDELFSNAARRIDDLLELEASPYTQNTHYFSSTRDDVLASFKKARQTGAPTAQGDTDKLADVLAALAAYGYSGVTEETLPRLLGGGVYEEELEAAAQTCAYWKVAYKRIIDDIPRIIDFAVVRPLPASLSRALLRRLVSGGESEVHRLMSESPELAAERAELNMRKKRLEDAKRLLAAFGRSL